MVRAPRKKPEPVAEPVEVVAEPYTEDDDWDGVPVTDEAVQEETEAPAKKGRPGSPLLQATRDYEKAHKAAEKSRKAAEKYRPQIDALEENERAEAEALARLTTLLNRTNDAEGDGDE
jgi:hypothetical protein